MLGVIGGVCVLAGALVSLYNGKKTREDNERQREHERDMARRSETNPNITVKTGKIIIDHNLIGDFAGLDSDTVGLLAKSGTMRIASK